MKWIIRTWIACSIFISYSFCSEKNNLPEVLGRVCAFGDFNGDRQNDILVSRNGNLTVKLQETKLLDLMEGPRFIDSTSWNIADEDPGTNIECSVGDFNGDGLLDVLVSIRLDDKKYNHTLYTAHADRSGFFPFHVGVFVQHAVTVDVTNDGWYDILAFYPNGSFYCSTVSQTGRINLIFNDCTNEFIAFPAVTNVYEGMPHFFVDINSDLRAELVFMTKGDDGSLIMSVWQQVKMGWTYRDWIPKLSSAQYQYVGAPLTADFDADGEMDILVPICREADCLHVTSLAAYSYNRKWSRPSIAIDMQDLEVQSEPNSKVLFRIGDFSLDTYPDLIAILVNRQQSKVVRSTRVLENVKCVNCEKNDTRKFEIKVTEYVQTKNMSLGTPKMSTFFDLLEDGNLELLIEYEFDKTTRFGFLKEAQKGDTTFLKVQIFTGLCGPSCLPHIHNNASIGLAGSCAQYSMTDGWGGSARSMACQVPSSSYRSLFLPFILFGLGRSPNFVDELNVAVPRYAENKEDWRHTLKQIVPNSRLIILPPTGAYSHWITTLYVTPSQLVLQSLGVMASVCMMLLIVVVFLHYREKKEDRYERQQQSHRFHFDAM